MTRFRAALPYRTIRADLQGHTGQPPGEYLPRLRLGVHELPAGQRLESKCARSAVSPKHSRAKALQLIAVDHAKFSKGGCQFFRVLQWKLQAADGVGQASMLSRTDLCNVGV